MQGDGMQIHPHDEEWMDRWWERVNVRQPVRDLRSNRPDLTRLDLTHTAITQEGVEELSDALKANTSLLNLKLGNCNLGDESEPPRPLLARRRPCPPPTGGPGPTAGPERAAAPPTPPQTARVV
mmetsp:Transcript_62872/g.151171  ORF Transcript_62872/g.151171 Transcript_62872/m.151171 type:complete len:124 (+) Transcript_62872:430-801(+)